MQILFLGPPAAGKGTQGKRLAKHLDIPHLSSGDLLRQAVADGTPAGKEASSFIDKGNLVPDPVLIEMFREQLRSPACAEGFILDGFPRNVVQARSLNQLLDELNRKLDAVINLQVSHKLIMERITGRRVCTNCGAQYHVKFAMPKIPNTCDVCGGTLQHRSDDTPTVVAQRLEVYDQETAPLIEYYDGKLLMRTVDGDGDPDEIFADVLRTLKITACY